jgi:NAD-dependent deacetylase
MSPSDQLSAFLAASKRAVAFTGAGISTESGIPDFRSPGGVWTRHQPVMYGEFVASRAARVRFWKARIEMYKEFRDAKPNDGHLGLARLEAAGRLCGIITQNIDGLHQLAGSRNVIELHGTARVVACIGCGREWTPDAVHAMVAAGDDAPDCDACGSPLKSKTISFGQAMPEREMALAARFAADCDLMLAIGSSLVVEPAASIPRIGKSNGARLVIINRGETPLDLLADLIIRDSIGRTLCAASQPRS